MFYFSLKDQAAIHENIPMVLKIVKLNITLFYYVAWGKNLN